MRLCAILWAVSAMSAAEHRGQVTFNGLPVPGASVTLGNALKTITDAQGLYSFSDLKDGTWNITVDMFGFESIHRDVVIAPNAPAAIWELKMLPLDRIQAAVQRPAPEPPREAAPGASEDDGFLINGSVNNSATTPFSLPAAFGNNRSGGKGLYNGGVGMTFDNSALDARPYSLTGQNTPQAAYNRLTGMATLGGPLFPRGPFFFLAYQWARNRNASTASALMPDPAERAGVFARPITDPQTGLPFPDDAIPQTRISPQARALLLLYPKPNFSGRYNYQISLLTPTHQDAFESRFNKTFGPKNQVYGRFALESTRADKPSAFGFLDTSSILGINTGANWAHRFHQGVFLNLGYQFSRLATHIRPYFQDRENVSGAAGISGNNQDPMNWGPPALTFTDGIATLTDAQSAFSRNQTSGVSVSMLWNRDSHNVSFGADFRRQQFNYLSQQDPRGALTFTGAATGSPFADFLLGIPATSSIAFGNADKYLRGSLYDAFFTDDWRINSALTINAGLRWEYGAPTTELYGRLANLAIAPGFTAASPVVSSLLRPDRRGFQPRVGIAWRPLVGSSLIVRAGYGIYYDGSVYPAIALQMAQQPPLSKTLRVQNSPATPLTLADPFSAPAAFNTFAVDPNLRIGYAQNWQLSVQHDLPAALQLTATYLGIKGTHGRQEFLPNTYPTGAVSPSGFTCLTSNGNSSRQSGQLQLRRRLHNGLTATLQYAFAKAIDDSSPNGIAQNWLDLRAERGLSSFDQRHLLSLNTQYTTGMALGRGRLFKEWTFAAQITAGSGLPETPIWLAPVPGTGVTGTIRPDYTGAPLESGAYLNPAAYAAPQPGRWGNAGRNTIAGPAQFALNASLGRTFRMTDRLNLDLRVDAANALNHVNYTAWNTVVNNAQFGLPASANAMRSLHTTLRVRF